ncbi:MAG: GldG family protein [Deltaproteobacteria bacterium]|jgi:ABC-type uncharacterized transport system involved in gliding motility auxiliary subunit|nr:GldG family protein [Deltaproteobacteria bacterium]
MKNKLNLLAASGCVCIVFGLICLTWVVVSKVDSSLTYLELGVGFLMLIVWLFLGGIKNRKTESNRQLSQYSWHILYSVLFILVLVALNYIAQRETLFSYDSTEQKIYTLAPQTVGICSGLENPVTISAFFLGGKIDDFKLLDLLQRISKLSNKLTWRVVDPEKEPVLVEKYRIKENKTLHFLLQTPQGNRELQISQILTEQEIVNALLKLSNASQKKVYYIFGHGETALDDHTETGYAAITKAILGEGVQLELLNLLEAKNIPEDADAIILAAPKRELLNYEVQAVTDYLTQGGSGIFLAEPRGASSVAKIVKDFGILVGNNLVVEQQLLKEQGGLTLSVMPVITIYMPHAVTQNFREGIVFNLASSVQQDTEFVKKYKGVEVVELALSSKRSWAETKLDLIFGENPTAAFEPSEDLKGPVPVIVGYEKRDAKFKAPSRIVVFGDEHFINNVNVRQLYNRDFFLNALNWVLSNERGITIRSGTMRASRAKITPEQFYYMFVLGVILIPQLLIMLGVYIWLSRD